MTTPNPDLSELPDAILRTIGQRLEKRDDILRFRAVCKKFQSLLPAPPRRCSFEHTALILPYPVCFTPMTTAHYELSISRIYAIRPLTEFLNPNEVAPTWVVNVVESANGRVRVKDTLSRFMFSGLSERLPRTLNLLDYEVTELGKSYELDLVIDRNFDIAIHTSIAGMTAYMLEKVVVSDECNQVMALHTGGKLAIWKRGDGIWNDLGVSYFADIVFYNRKFYAVNGDGITIAVDCNTSNITFVVADRQPTLSNGYFKYFMKLDQDLYLIVKCWVAGYPRTSVEEIDDRMHIRYPVELIVFMLDEENGRWVETWDGFKDRVPFVGDGCSYSLRANEFPGSKPNCIYFSDSLFNEYRDVYPGWNGGIFDIEDRRSTPLSSWPGYSGIFWPPPAWLR